MSRICFTHSLSVLLKCDGAAIVLFDILPATVMTIERDFELQDQDLMLGRLTRQLRETERNIVAVQVSLKLAWQELMQSVDDIIPVVNQGKTDGHFMARARVAALKMPDRDMVIDGLRELECSIARIAELKKAIDEMIP